MGTLRFMYLQDVDDEGEDVADEEDQHDYHQHRCQANLLLLQPETRCNGPMATVATMVLKSNLPKK